MRRLLRSLLSTMVYPFLSEEGEGTLRVLTYHRVNAVSPTDRLSVSPTEFRRQMDFLKRQGYRTVTAEEVSDMIRGGKPLPGRSVLITFDDGYRDNFLEAFPILKEFHYKATIFIATSLIGDAHDGHPMLTWEDVKTMASEGISFGSHTVHHVHMNGVPPEEKLREAERSKRLLEEKLGKEVVSFCYPFGDYDAEAKEALRKAGYRVAFTTRPGPVRLTSDPLELPRTEVSGFDTLFDFKKKLAGAFDRLHAMVQRKQGRNRSGRPLPVLYVIWSLGLGGAEQVVITLAKGLDRTRFRPLVACLNEAGPFSEALRAEGIPVIPLRKRGRFDLGVLPKLIRVMKEHRVVVVHTHLFGGDFWGRIAARLAGVQVIVATEHSYAGKSRAALWIDRILSLITDRMIVVSEEVRYFYARSLHIKPEKLQVIYNGIDFSLSDAPHRNGVREELGVGGETPLLGMIGRLTAVKAHEVFLEAIGDLRGRHPSVTALIIGEGERRTALESFCQRRGIERNVRFLGLRKDVRRLLPHLDMVVLSSDSEGFSMTLLEAMAAGLPVVTTDVGGTSELVVEGQTGFLVPPRDPQTLADRIERLLKDKALAKKMGAEGRRRVEEHFSLQRMIAETESLYQTLLSSKTKGMPS